LPKTVNFIVDTSTASKFEAKLLTLGVIPGSEVYSLVHDGV